MKSSSRTIEIEVGGQILEIHGTYYPGDHGKTSGPPERCYPPEPESFEPDKIVLQTWVTEDLAPAGMKKTRQVLVDITDLVSELGGSDIIDQVIADKLSDIDFTEDPPEPDE